MGTSFERGWQREMFWLCILWRIVEHKDIIPVDVEGTQYSFLEDPLFRMSGEGLIKLGGQYSDRWEATSDGIQALGKIVAVFDHALKFEIFGNVDIGMELPDDVSEDGDNVLDHVYDPRFDPERDTDTTYDLRIAMMSYLSDRLVQAGKLNEVLDPHRVVFVQKLADGEFATDDFWTDLAMGTLHKQVAEVVSTAYMPGDLSDDDDEVNSIMEAIYTAGMLEQQKRDGNECSECGAVLALFEAEARAEGGRLEACPNPDCDGVFIPPPPEYKYDCPNCEHGIYGHERVCPGCGANINFSMPAGTVAETVEEHTETVYEDVYDPWGYGYGYYGYTPYGYYDPYDPFVDALAFGVVCAIIF